MVSSLGTSSFMSFYFKISKCGWTCDIIRCAHYLVRRYDIFMLSSYKRKMEFILPPLISSKVMRYRMSFVHPQSVNMRVFQFKNLVEHAQNRFFPAVI